MPHRRRHPPLAQLAACTCALLGLVELSCARDVAPAAYREDEVQHLGNDWYAYRAKGLGISVEGARTRDAAISETEPPNGFWDEQTRAEAAALWVHNCAACHGIEGDPSTAPPADPPFDPLPRKWTGFGVTIGFFFGGDGMRAGIYERIRDGGVSIDGKPSRMPPWKESLSREQMWAIVYLIESL